MKLQTFRAVLKNTCERLVLLAGTYFREILYHFGFEDDLAIRSAQIRK